MKIYEANDSKSYTAPLGQAWFVPYWRRLTVYDVFPSQVRHCVAHLIKDEINRIEVYDFTLRRINTRVEARNFLRPTCPRLNISKNPCCRISIGLLTIAGRTKKNWELEPEMRLAFLELRIRLFLLFSRCWCARLNHSKRSLTTIDLSAALLAAFKLKFIANFDYVWQTLTLVCNCV